MKPELKMKSTQMSAFKSERGPFLWLLIAQVAFMATSPLATQSAEGQWIRIIGLFCYLDLRRIRGGRSSRLL